ncbi:MAG: penicillin-insensitive murein endopeptidase, partial [Sandaracinaceae bacterium]|nr:penicillin-insensitive murein endopeptidase [Sandaracinaceae bacterium]
GPIPHHGSHRVGRDADVLFYLLDREGRPIAPVGAFLDPRGRGYDFKDLAVPGDDVLVRLDAPRTWRFVQALLEGPHGGEVQRIFVAEHLRTLLLQQAERARAPRAVRDRFAEITCQPGYPHDDHFHVRFFCSAQDIGRGCQDASPIYPWRLQALGGVEPVLYRPRSDRPRAQTTTAAQARAEAGEMHSRVQEWLQMREAWMRAPHPGRTYCR